MDLIDGLRKKFAIEEFEFSKYAVDQTILREITILEIKEAILKGEVVEEYPDDKNGSSCLIFGFAKQERPIHVQCSNPSRQIIKVITVYEPDPEQWIEFRQRR